MKFIWIHLETNYGEDNDSSEHGCATIGDRHENGITKAIVIRWIIRTKGDESTESQTEREEYLCARLQPYHWLQNWIPTGGEKMD